jgi:hypothetical protein
MSTKSPAKRVRPTYEFIKTHRHKHSAQVMCRPFRVAPSGRSVPLRVRPQGSEWLVIAVASSPAPATSPSAPPRAT